ncbi:MAG TPA: hypothetical protein PLP19_11090 [bacterium]|nr:hypothetical protein [bacterium]HPN44026.1 hypothetical protein [bacterium]
MNIEDAINHIIVCLRSENSKKYQQYGYELYIPKIIGDYLGENSWDHQRSRVRELSPDFYAAAWELCRRGIIRPGIKEFDAQATDDGSSGNGYSITPFGKKWLEETNQDTFVPTEPDRFAKMLEPYKDRFGPGFYERAQEAIRCYGAHAYLACCAMCGAATESILLATAIAKTGDEKQVLKIYSSSLGRSRVENMIIGQVKSYLKEKFNALNELLKYWRDEAAHGKPTNISDNEAYTSIALLLRFAMSVNDNWDELTIGKI